MFQLLSSKYDFFFFLIQCHFAIHLFYALSILFAVLLFTFFLYFFEHVLCCLSALSHIASLFCFSFSPSLCFCLVKLPEKQFYSMNIKPLLDDSINFFQYFQYVCLFYEEHVFLFSFFLRLSV